MRLYPAAARSPGDEAVLLLAADPETSAESEPDEIEMTLGSQPLSLSSRSCVSSGYRDMS